MATNRFVQNICLLFSVLLISTMVNAGELAPETNIKVDDVVPKWQLSLIAGGYSEHFTHKFEPDEGYNEAHYNIGLEIGQAKPGWFYAGQASFFKDSYDRDSFTIFGSYGYRQLLPYDIFVNAVLGAGFVHTSYYTGPIALPLVEIGWWRISLQGSFIPQFGEGETGSDFLIATQFKFKLIEW